tara:strand:- start:287 stop:946 length:660 start_codon:yes stop_codon:yes gene_type:complete
MAKIKSKLKTTKNKKIRLHKHNKKIKTTQKYKMDGGAGLLRTLMDQTSRTTTSATEQYHKIKSYIELTKQMNELVHLPQVVEFFKTYSNINQKQKIESFINLLIKNDNEHIKTYITEGRLKDRSIQGLLPPKKTYSLSQLYEEIENELQKIPSYEIAESFKKNNKRTIKSISKILEYLLLIFEILKSPESGAFREKISDVEKNIYNESVPGIPNSNLFE